MRNEPTIFFVYNYFVSKNGIYVAFIEKFPSLRMSTTEDENSTMFQKDTEHKSKNSEFELRMQPSLERLMRYKEVLRRDLRETIKDLENLQNNRRVSANDEPHSKSETT